MKALLTLFAVILPLSFANAKTVTINVTDEFSYSEIVAYKDGTKAVTYPKMYGYFFDVTTRGEASDNAAAICFMLGWPTVLDYSVVRTGKGSLKTVLMKVEDGKLSEPSFARGGEMETLVMNKVLCR